MFDRRFLFFWWKPRAKFLNKEFPTKKSVKPPMSRDFFILPKIMKNYFILIIFRLNLKSVHTFLSLSPLVTAAPQQLVVLEAS
jgi:hypothetical protein